MTDLFGLVLMGGRSSRMGEDKSRLDYHGRPQREHLTALLSHFCPAVFWSVNAEQAIDLAHEPARLIVDAHPVAGPMAGILSALDAHPGRAWLVVACDLPLLDQPTLTALVAGRHPAYPATAFWDSDHTGPEPLVSLWEPTARPLLRPFVESGQRSPRRFLQQYAGPLLEVPDSRALLNVNDQEGRAEVKRRLG